MFDIEKFFAVSPQDVDRARPMLEPLLTEFFHKTHHIAPADIFRQAKAAEAQIWGYHDGERMRMVVVTRIHPMAKGKLCSLWVCVGNDTKDFLEGFYAELEKWACSVGCYAMEIVGRAGWLKKLPGFTKEAVVLSKSLIQDNQHV